MTLVIETERLTKVYSGGNKAVDDLTLAVEPGEIFGYLGPNGAGKTTTIHLLLDVIRPTRGGASLFGLDVRRDRTAIHARIGFLPAELNLWKNLTAREVIDHFARLRGGVDKAWFRTLTERLQFDASRRIRSYSTGNKRKLGLVLAMMHQPELLILDEPSSGLDPLMQQTFNQLMLETKSEGRTVFLSSHVLGEVQAICDRVGILNAGQLQMVSRVDALTHAAFRWVTVRVRGPVSALHLAGIPGVDDVTVADDVVRLRLTGDFDPLLRALDGTYVEDVEIERPTLEEIFLTYYTPAARTTPEMQL